MLHLRGGILIMVLACWLVMTAPSPVEGRHSFAKPIYLDNLFSSQPQASRPAGALPEPQTARVQIYIFKKSSLLLPTAALLAAPPAPGSPGRQLAIAPGDPRLQKIILKYASQQGLDPRLVQAVIRHESGFNPMAVSPKGAMGLMQLMPETAAFLGVEDPFDVEQNIKGGVRFLKICLNRFDQNLPLALAAYNAGPGRVVTHQGVPPIKETQDYVKKVVLDYNGQTVDPTLIKLSEAAAAKPAPESPAAPCQPSAPAAPPQLFHLPFFSFPTGDTPGGLLIP